MLKRLIMCGVIASTSAACGNPSATTVAQDSGQAAADVAAAGYSVCVDKATAAVDLDAGPAPQLAGLAVKACQDKRAEVVAKVAAAQVASGKDAATAAALAEKAVRVADSELRDRANTVIVRAKLKAS